MNFPSMLARLSDIFGRPGIPLSNRNLFIDPGFDQLNAGVARGSAQPVTTTSAYNALAMWSSYCGAGGAGNIQGFDLRASSPVTYAAFEKELSNIFVYQQSTASTGTVAAGNAPQIIQKIEGGNTGAGKSLTFSIKLWVSSGSITIPAIRLAQNFGAGGSPSASSNFDKTVNWNVTTTPQKFSVRIDVPNVAGKVFGTSGGDFLAVGLYLPPGVTFTIGGGEAQLEYSNPNSSSDINGNGGAPTAFEYRGQQPEAARVQRYYQQFGAPFGAGAFSSATQGFYDMDYPGGPMRGAPAISFNGTFQCSYPGNNIAVSGTNMAATGQSPQATLLTAVVSGMTAGQGSVLWGNTGAVVILDSRL